MSSERQGGVVRRKIARNVLWNALGTGLPMLVALFTIPRLVKALGPARFGVLSLAWMVVGYFSLFDLGLARAMTKVVAEKLGRREVDDIPALIWAALTLMAALGTAGTLVTLALAPYLVGGLLSIPEDLRGETLDAVRLLGLSIPIVITTSGLRGILEAYQRFGLATFVRVPLGTITYLGPLAVLPFSRSLTALVAVLVGARTLSMLAYLSLCLKVVPELRSRRRPDMRLMRRLLAFGGWMTVSNVVGPLLLYLGRFLIAVLVSAEAVAYFATPYEAVAGLLLIPGVLVGVLFPAFSESFHRDPRDVAALYRRGRSFLLAVMVPASLITIFFARSGLRWWVGEDFSAHGFRVAQLLGVGVLVNSLGHLSQALVQAYGRPDLTAKLHVLELLAYVPYLWVLTRRWGIDGVAVAWVIRVSISTLVLGVIAKACMKGSIASTSSGGTRAPGEPSMRAASQ